MKKYIPLTTLVASSLFFTSCGDKKDDATTTTESSSEVVQKSDAHKEVKDALKSQVNSSTADLMLKTPSFADLPPAQYDIPESLEGRDMVQVSVKWAFVAKDDLYELDSVISELPNKPTIVEKKHSKGDEIDYVEAMFVLQADGGGGYVMQNSRFMKSNFSFGNLSTLDKFDGATLVKGSDEHMNAAKEASAIKQAEEEKRRLAEIEAEKQRQIAEAEATKKREEAEAKKRADALAKKEQLLKVLTKEGNFRGLIGDPEKPERYDIEFKVTAIEEHAGETEVKVSISHIYNGEKYTAATFSGTFDDKNELYLRRLTRGKSPKLGFIANSSRDSRTNVISGDHIDKIKIGMVDSYNNKYIGTLIRK